MENPPEKHLAAPVTSGVNPQLPAQAVKTPPRTLAQLAVALIFTVFASWVQSLATTSFDSYGDYSLTARGISCATMSTGVIFSVYEARQECGMSIPSAPFWIARFTSCGRESKPKVVSSDIYKHHVDSKSTEAKRILEHVLIRIGRSELLPQLIDDQWDHMDVLEGIEESHMVEIGLKPGTAVRFVRDVRHLLKITRQGAPKNGPFKLH